jgi:hypothetical protein
MMLRAPARSRQRRQSPPQRASCAIEPSRRVPIFAEVTIVLGRRLRRPVRYRMALVLPRGESPRTEVCGTIDAFDRARRPPVHLGHPNIGSEAVQHRFVRRPSVRRHPRLRACVDPLLQRVERLQRVCHAWPRPPGNPRAERTVTGRCGNGPGCAAQLSGLRGWCGRSWSCMRPSLVGLLVEARLVGAAASTHVTLRVGRRGAVSRRSRWLRIGTPPGLRHWPVG